ncbi:hypothetical protein [Tsuneonella sp. SYSU-LHT278]|uniref:hypothetical protein n=1 Tax=Tsuneonella sediminis TaxID=3416089 RepID=UPI003F78C92D
MTRSRRWLWNLILAVGWAAALATPAGAQEKSNITGLSDAHFGLIAGTTDARISQSVCAFTSSRIDRYSVRAQGSGPSSDFVLGSGPFALRYEVLWSDTANDAGGTSLVPNTVSGGFVSQAKQHSCRSGEPSTATLSIVLRSHALERAYAGTYSGSLQITLAPE